VNNSDLLYAIGAFLFLVGVVVYFVLKERAKSRPSRPAGRPRGRPAERVYRPVTWELFIASAMFLRRPFAASLAVIAGIVAVAVNVQGRPIEWTDIYLLIGALACLAGCAAWAWSSFRRYARRYPAPVSVTDAGLEWESEGGKQSRTWGQVQSVLRSAETYDRRFGKPADRSGLVIRFEDGVELRYNQILENYVEFASAVQQKAAAALRPACRESVERGGAEFGPVRVTATELVVGEDRLPWEEVEAVWVGRPRSALKAWLTDVDTDQFGWQGSGRRGRSIPLDGIPNYQVLVELIHERIGDRLTASI
jgi:hypothetical protein